MTEGKPDMDDKCYLPVRENQTEAAGQAWHDFLQQD